jgi:tetratricopeptide (TPR) repeat protein
LSRLETTVDDHAIIHVMKIKTISYLYFSGIILLGFILPVYAVTDAELEALEKQLEQQEIEAKEQAKAESKNKAEEEAKRKAAQKRKLEVEAKRKHQDELDRLAEEEAKIEAEKAKLAEMERLRQEEEEKKKAEKINREQFSQHMKNAESAMNDKKYDEALESYSKAIEIFSNDVNAIAGQSSARELKDACAAIVGEWDWAFDIFVIISADGNLQAKALISNHGKWECTDPLQRKFTLRWVVGGWVDTITLSPDGNFIEGVNNLGFGFQAWRKGTKEFNPSREINL